MPLKGSDHQIMKKDNIFSHLVVSSLQIFFFFFFAEVLWNLSLRFLPEMNGISFVTPLTLKNV